MTELAFVLLWCAGLSEVTLDDRTRVDCLEDSVAWEVDRGANWKEAVGQALHYGRMTQRRPGVLLLDPAPRHIEQIQAVIEHWALPIKVTAAHKGSDNEYTYKEIVP